MHANGGREEANNFLLDGVDNNDSDVRGYTLEPSVDSIQEFKIATNSYSAEYGSASAGQVNIITRGGSNEFHGTVYDYLRNRDLDARNFFGASDKPEYIRNQFGAALGGPVIRNSTFFYGIFEGLREDQGQTQLGTFPPPGFDPATFQAWEARKQPVHRSPVPGARDSALPDLAPCRAVSDAVSRCPICQAVPEIIWAILSGLIDRTKAVSGLTTASPIHAQLTLRYNYGRQNLFEPYAENQTELPGFGDYVFDRGHNALIQLRADCSVPPRLIPCSWDSTALFGRFLGRTIRPM